MKLDIKRYVALGITLLAVFAVCIVLYFCIGKYATFVRYLKKIISIVSPFIYGGIIAYVLSHISNFFEKYVIRVCTKFIKSNKKAKFAAEKISIVLSYLFICLIIYIFIRMVMPQVIDSLKSIFTKIPEWINELYAFYNKISEMNPQVGASLNEYANKLYLQANAFFKSGIFNNAKLILSEFSIRVMEFANGILNLVVAVIVSVYILNGRKTFKAQFKKLIYAVFNKKWADAIIEECRFADVSFGGFIIGKVIDSFIIGIIAFVVLTIMDMPFTMLLAVIIGITNIVPFFGPIIGAIPGCILIVFVSPLKALYFIIFIFILQQFDGNILGPKILGDKVGIPSIWVLFSILIFGSAWGVFGMIVGVPLFAVIIDIVTKVVNMLLKKRGMSCDTKDYMPKAACENDEK